MAEEISPELRTHRQGQNPLWDATSNWPTNSGRFFYSLETIKYKRKQLKRHILPIRVGLSKTGSLIRT